MKYIQAARDEAIFACVPHYYLVTAKGPDSRPGMDSRAAKRPFPLFRTTKRMGTLFVCTFATKERFGEFADFGSGIKMLPRSQAVPCDTAVVLSAGAAFVLEANDRRGTTLLCQSRSPWC
jgi:hypothetical protein